MIDIDELRRRHLNFSENGMSVADNWYIANFSSVTLRALLDELEALRAANTWLPIETAKKRIGYAILLYAPTPEDEDYDYVIGVGSWNGFWACADFGMGDVATHWMPLPTPPTGDDQ